MKGETDMDEYTGKAIEKLKSEEKAMKGSTPMAMNKAVREALESFCRQDDEFAEAVVQGGSFAECMDAVAKGVTGSCISDLDAYRLAVQFYFKGADIRFQMTIDLIGQLDKDGAPADIMGPKVLDLADFF